MTINELFFCTGNTERSPTGEALLKFDNRYKANSAGIIDGSPVKVTRELLDWADVIFAMQEAYKKAILDNAGNQEQNRSLQHFRRVLLRKPQVG